jgi:8-oxo-dGTP diphosphatase
MNTLDLPKPGTDPFVHNYPKKTFEHVIVAVDVVIMSVFDHKLHVLLLEPKDPVLGGNWAIPGGLVKLNESLDDAVGRHLEAKAGISGVHLEQIYTFGDVDRDPQGRVVSVAYMALCRKERVHPATSDRYNRIEWFAMDNLPPLGYDHPKILKAAHDRLMAKLSYTNVIYNLLPDEFTLTEMQNYYEYILGHKLDKRNFRKKVLSLGLLKQTEKMTSGSANRPAMLYSFRKRESETVDML